MVLIEKLKKKLSLLTFFIVFFQVFAHSVLKFHIYSFNWVSLNQHFAGYRYVSITF